MENKPEQLTYLSICVGQYFIFCVDHCLLDFFSFDYCIACSSMYVFWLSLWYLHLLTIVLSALLCTSSHYPFGIFIFWLLYYLLFYLRLLITPLVSSSFDYCIACSSIYVFSLLLCYLHLLTIVLPALLFTFTDYPFGIFKLLLCFSYIVIIYVHIVSWCVSCFFCSWWFYHCISWTITFLHWSSKWHNINDCNLN